MTMHIQASPASQACNALDHGGDPGAEERPRPTKTLVAGETGREGC
jgi:hypothetical protein